MDPGGTLTFLFTDVEGSSRRWEQHLGAMPAALARHDELLAAAVAGHGGTVFKHTGDGVCAVFGTARAASAAAVAAQRALLAEDWGEVGALTVRMAVHTGTAGYRDGDWFGPALNRTARVLATAHGGQVVVSLAAEELVRDDLPPKVELVDLGEYPLRDLARTERVFQLTHPDLPSVFPPLRSQGTQRHNLPNSANSFVGRQRELAEVAVLLNEAPLVTLTGVGGTGKTRLALEAAAAAVGSFPDGVFLVELAPLTDPDLVVSQVLMAFGVSGDDLDPAPGGALGRLIRYLATRHTLVVLDNCEHLLDAVARLAQVLVERCPEVTILTTSREALGLPGERAWRVPSLSLPAEDRVHPEALVGSDAVALFCDRAHLVDPSFALTAGNARAVGWICRRLDGLPLALELAAARLRVLSVEQIVERLDDRFRLLTGGARFALPRHRTLRAAVDWSWELLSDREQALLRHLSVFPGKFSLGSAEVVAADGGAVKTEDVLDLLTALVDKSLLSVERGDDEVSYVLLETIRQYAAERLAEAGEVIVTRDRHLDHFLVVVQSLGVFYQWGDGVFFQVLTADQDNFRTALEWSLARGKGDAAMRLAGALAWFWANERRFNEGCAWLMRALATDTDVTAETRSQTLAVLAHLVLQQGDPDRAWSLMEESRAFADSTGQARVQSTALFLSGRLALQRGEAARAKGLLEEARAGFESIGWSAGTAWCRFEKGWVALARGDREAAVAAFEAAMAQSQSGSGGVDALVALTGDNAKVPIEAAAPDGELHMHIEATLAPVIASLGDLPRAEKLAAIALNKAKKLGRRHLVMIHVRTAEMWVLAGQASRARECLLQALTLLRDLGARAWVADSLELTAIVLADHAQARSAARLAGSAEELRHKPGGVQLVQHALEQTRAKAQQALGPDQYATELALGRELAPDDALRYAQEELEGL
jgi:predicted ATPase/class 3 adenylate cyclase